MKRIHHSTPMKEICTICDKPFLMNWYDANEQNGRSETRFTAKSGGLAHYDCITKENGRPPLSLRDINDMIKKKMTQDQYYKSKGY